MITLCTLQQFLWVLLMILVLILVLVVGVWIVHVTSEGPRCTSSNSFSTKGALKKKQLELTNHYICLKLTVFAGKSSLILSFGCLPACRQCLLAASFASFSYSLCVFRSSLSSSSSWSNSLQLGDWTFFEGFRLQWCVKFPARKMRKIFQLEQWQKTFLVVWPLSQGSLGLYFGCCAAFSSPHPGPGKGEPNQII